MIYIYLRYCIVLSEYIIFHQILVVHSISIKKMHISASKYENMKITNNIPNNRKTHKYVNVRYAK